MEWTLANIVRTHAAARADAPMITFGERVVSYGEMAARAARVAQGLGAAGIRPQDRVAFLDKNGLEYFEVLFGGGMANVVNVAVNWRLAPAEMAYIIADAGARVLFVGADFFPHLEEIESALPAVEKIVAIGDHPRHEGYEATRSVQNMKGYWNNPSETAGTLITDGWLRTGDAGFMDADGYLFLTDRVKDMIVSGGENVYPAEVENALSGHPDVADVAVIGVPDERWGETVKAIVVRRPGSAPTPESIIEHARQRLARYKCPTSVDFAEALLRNPAGKLLKRQLREPYWQGHARRIN